MEKTEAKLDEIIALLKTLIIVTKGSREESLTQLMGLTKEVKTLKYGEGYPSEW